MPPPPPTITSFLLADQVFRQDGPRGKWCVIGIFDTIYTASFPTIHPSIGLYLKVGNAEGKYEFRIEFSDAEQHLVGRVVGKMEAVDRIGRGDIGFQVLGLVLPKEGRYFVNVYFNEQQAVSDYYFDARIPPQEQS